MGNTPYKYSLFMIVCLSILSVVLGADWGTGGSAYGSSSYSFNIDPLLGAIGMILVLVIVGVVFGIKLFGSGIDSESVRTMIIGLGYTGLWTTFSVLAMPLLIAINWFGLLFYLILTILFVIGVFDKIAGGKE